MGSTCWDSFGLIVLAVHFSSQVWKVFRNYYFKYILCPFVFCSDSGISRSWVVSFHVCHNSYRVSSLFFFLFFLFTPLDNFQLYPLGCWFFTLWGQIIIQFNYNFFSTLRFLLFDSCCFLMKLLILFMHCFPNFFCYCLCVFCFFFVGFFFVVHKTFLWWKRTFLRMIFLNYLSYSSYIFF